MRLYIISFLFLCEISSKRKPVSVCSQWMHSLFTWPKWLPSRLCHCIIFSLQKCYQSKIAGSDFVLSGILNWLHIQQTYHQDIPDMYTEISLRLCLAHLADKQASLTGATRSSNKSCFCLLFCQSSKNKVDITGMAHREICAPLCYLFLKCL